MKDRARQLKSRYTKVPLFMIYLLLLATNKKLIGVLVITLYILGIVSMLYCIVLGVMMTITGVQNSAIFLCASVLLLLGFIILLIKDMRQMSQL